MRRQFFFGLVTSVWRICCGSKGFLLWEIGSCVWFGPWGRELRVYLNNTTGPKENGRLNLKIFF
ncbi:hypothetical protein QN363_20890, partial [Undibacterium sp. CCC2.1]|uniref:hypothetical protein n=1 Tax=Undibacterium sp. CCC2.1 TaxID=3048604 RepID=UPI002B23E60B